ncbi:MAG: hypothetical protein ROO73_01490 [Roseivirga sp.]
MAQTLFRTDTISLGGYTPDSQGKLTIAENKFQFSTKVISCGVSLQSWKLSFPTYYDIKVCGAGIDNVQYYNNEVVFDAWLQFFDTVHKVVPADSELVALISAYVE